ncbi:AlpA family phage regulatory protein [Hyphomonadaceae bacterium ML37]|nr:AlpA family phage regulatory protein [Hyphomonadaceae bacterium ML37]
MTLSDTENDRLITANPVKELLGGKSDMTIWRMLADPELDFPKPIYIGKRRHWWLSEILAWIERQRNSA